MNDEMKKTVKRVIGFSILVAVPIGVLSLYITSRPDPLETAFSLIAFLLLMGLVYLGAALIG